VESSVKSPAELVEIPPELKELQTRYLGEVLTNLITRDTPKAAIKTSPGRGGVYPYVPVYWFVPQLNALFGFLWDVVVDDKGIVEENIEVEEEIIPERLSQADIGRLRVQHKLEKIKKTVRYPTQVWVSGHLTFKIPGRTVTKYNRKEDYHEEIRYDPVTVTKHAFGGTDIKYYSDRSENAGMIIDLADDYKSAEADMLKKAASYLGMCADVFGKRELLQETGPNEGQLKALYRRAETKGLNKVQTVELSQKLFEGYNPEDLDSGQYLKFMQHLLGRKVDKIQTR